MKVKFRRGCQYDLEQVYELHTKCFSTSDQWYKSAIKHYLDKGIIVETINKDTTKKIIGVLLQGGITVCNQKMDVESVDQQADATNIFDYSSKLPNLNTKANSNDGYKEDIFEPVTSNGKIFLSKNLHLKELYGIVMICIDPEFRGKGLAKKLIEKHCKDNPSKVLCLNTRRSNISAFMLYKSMGYEHIAYIKNKYFLPTEDSIFMIKEQIQIINE
jgi:ribosomal protein S18 acetylase RimI-like enzyme